MDGVVRRLCRRASAFPSSLKFLKKNAGTPKNGLAQSMQRRTYSRNGYARGFSLQWTLYVFSIFNVPYLLCLYLYKRLTLPASNNFIPKDFILITPPLLGTFCYDYYYHYYYAISSTELSRCYHGHTPLPSLAQSGHDIWSPPRYSPLPFCVSVSEYGPAHRFCLLLFGERYNDLFFSGSCAVVCNGSELQFVSNILCCRSGWFFLVFTATILLPF
jgi:hypothetical protein